MQTRQLPLPAPQLPFLRLAFVLLGIFVLLVSAVHAFGSFLPPPAGLLQMRLSECALPCWMSIIPGTTTMRQAAQHLSTANLGGPMSEAPDGRSMWGEFEVNGSRVYVQVHANEEGLVRQIVLISSLVDGIVFGDVVSTLGVPTCGRFDESFVLYSGDSAEALITAVDAHGERGIHAPLNNINIRPRFEDYNRCLALAQ